MNKTLKKLREKISCAKDGLEYVEIENQVSVLKTYFSLCHRWQG